MLDMLCVTSKNSLTKRELCSPPPTELADKTLVVEVFLCAFASALVTRVTNECLCVGIMRVECVRANSAIGDTLTQLQ